MLDFSGTGLNVRLSQEACLQALPSPKRASRHLATLQDGATVRIVLNGKADWPSGRYYYLQDYHVIFRCGAAETGFEEPRTIDLQADLV
ncbi:hypothetical protein [Paludibaculum fermentans]|uniref:Uncharacterized protein n=1 Tax=Paludibaculum fermentans TaxID=1473598 RepID=A0A7S7NRC9_PALFE|nr:hypothetical protein [Paludibaculum fermentans]QOY88348.1 hypothetical protein IRI77_37405 [Paludibaculum fermentans]